MSDVTKEEMINEVNYIIHVLESTDFNKRRAEIWKEIKTLIDRTDKPRGWEADALFIKHIEGHLESGEEVVCKICGKTAGQIISEDYKPEPGITMNPHDGSAFLSKPEKEEGEYTKAELLTLVFWLRDNLKKKAQGTKEHFAIAGFIPIHDAPYDKPEPSEGEIISRNSEGEPIFADPDCDSVDLGPEKADTTGEGITQRKILARLQLWKDQVEAYGRQSGTGKRYVWGEWDEKAMSAIKKRLRTKPEKADTTGEEPPTWNLLTRQSLEKIAQHMWERLRSSQYSPSRPTVTRGEAWEIWCELNNGEIEYEFFEKWLTDREIEVTDAQD